MVMEHLEHIDSSNGQYLHAGQGGFPSNEAYQHNLMYAPSGGFQYLAPAFNTAPTSLSPQQQQAVLFSHNNATSNSQHAQQSNPQQLQSLQLQQHGQVQGQQGQATPSPGQPNGSIGGGFQNFTPSDQLGNEFAYFSSQSSTPQPSTTQQATVDFPWASATAVRPNGDAQQQQQQLLHAQQQAQFQASQRALVERQAQARAQAQAQAQAQQHQQQQQQHAQSQAQQVHQAHQTHQLHTAQQQHLAQQRQQQFELQQQQLLQQQRRTEHFSYPVQEPMSEAIRQGLVPVQTPPPTTGKMTRSRSQPGMRLGVLANIQLRAATPIEKDATLRAYSDKRVFSFSEQWTTEAESGSSSEIEVMQPQAKKLKVEVVIPTRKSDGMASASTMTSDVSMMHAAQAQNQVQSQVKQDTQQFQQQLQRPQLQQAQRAQSQQSANTPPPHIKQESIEPQQQRPKIPAPEGPAELRWRMNTMLANMVPSHDAQGNGLFENVKDLTDLMSSVDREDMRTVAVQCMENAPAGTIRAMASAGSAGKLFSGKVQTWLAKLINKEEDFNDNMASTIIRIFHNMDIPYSRLEALKFVKARKVIAKKHPNSETLRLVDILLDKGKKLEGIKVDVPRQSAAAAASASLKRKPEDDANLSAAKKPTPHAPLIKAPQNVPKPSAPSAPIGLRPAGSATNVAPKQTTGFFKALKPVEKPAVTKPAQPLPSFKRQTAPPPPQQPSAPTTTFSSIFDQLKERQRKEEDAKSKQAADKAKPEEVKKVKKKKSVRWKMESELTEVKEFEVLEPEGEYYGGGSGMDHQWGDARSLDVSEGRDALNALKNRKMLEDEVDETIDWYQPIPLDTAEFYKRYPAGEKSPIKRFGKEMPKDDDAQVQKKREETVLAVLYFHEKDIPPSPAEPPEGETGIDEAPAYEPAPVVLPAASSGMPDLSKILAQFQQTAAASMAGANGPQKPAVSTPPVSTPAPAATASAPPKPEANPVDALLQSLAAMTQGAPPPPPPKIELPQFNIPPIPPPKPAEQPNPLASFLPGLLGGVSQPQQSAPPVAPDMAALFQSLNIPQPQGQQQQQQNNNILAGLLQTLNPAMASAWGQPQQQQYDYGQNMDWQRSRDDEDRGRNVREKVRERTGWSGDRDRDRDRDDHDKYGSSSNNNNNNNHRGNQGKHNFKDKKNKNKNRKDKPYKKRTVPCSFYQQDKCLKGNECPFLHTME